MDEIDIDKEEEAEVTAGELLKAFVLSRITLDCQPRTLANPKS
jgi:hypothetical protein